MQQEKMDPTRLTIEELARVLTASGQMEITPARVQKEVDEGFQLNDDGTINIIHYTAWLLKTLGYGPKA